MNPFLFLVTCFPSKRFYIYSWQHCAPPQPPHSHLCLFFMSRVWTLCFERQMERKWFIHQTRHRIQIPADLLITWVILQVSRAAAARMLLLVFSLEHGERVIMSPVVALGQHTRGGRTVEDTHTVAPNSNQKGNYPPPRRRYGRGRRCVFLFRQISAQMCHIGTFRRQIKTHESSGIASAWKFQDWLMLPLLKRMC